MSIIALYLIIAGALAAISAAVWFVVVAFQRHVAWGLAVLLVPFANLVFLIRAWEEARRPFFVSVVGFVLCAFGIYFSPHPMAKQIVALCSDFRFFSGNKVAENPTPQTPTDKMAELRVREKALLARKAALKPGDMAGAEALAAEIKAYNVELKAALAQLSRSGTRMDAHGLWTTTLAVTQVPDTPATGRVGGQTFSIDRAWLENGRLTLRHGAGLFPEHEFVIFLNEQNPAGRTFNVTAQTRSDVPHVHMKHIGTNRKMEETKIFTDGYAMRLEFGEAVGGQIDGGIYLCLPDPARSYLVGTFRARVVSTEDPFVTALK